MSNTPLIFLGLFAAMAGSFWGLLLAPQLQIGRQDVRPIEATGEIYPAPRPGLAQEGAEVYRANGCVECHTRQVRQTGVAFDVWLHETGTNMNAVVALLSQAGMRAGDAAALVAKTPARVRSGLPHGEARKLAAQLTDAAAKASADLVPLGPDIARGWGSRLSVAQDYLRDNPVLLGSLRLGPDLANIGARQTNAIWHLLHLYDPRLTVPGSSMPRYPYLFEKRSRPAGAPRSPEALPLDDDAAGAYEVVPRPEAHALVAYLISLKMETPLFEAPMPPVRAAASAPTP
ncbi:MAG TPA: cbb3-type cytochrome c oxidase subunit II [Methylomirabilota bacterium]|nr:cbb3-type cytochrome c oxidase subunit II [Methylomirabilota bacterium]